MAASVRRLLAASPIVLVATLTVGSGFGTVRPAAQTAIREVTFSDTRLKNGLRVVIAEDHAAPVFALAVNYDVGSRDERRGRTGFAHLFEHMMFKGSENVGALEHPHLIFTNGGSMNGTTNKERTLYFEILPANQLDLALFLEADRMRSLEITAANLENQRQAVQEERRLGVDNQPYGRTFEVRDELAYENFAYAHSVIGSMADLSAATVDDVASFFKTYYAPNNAVLSIVGAVDAKVTLEKVRTYFESIPSQPAPPVVDAAEPAQTAERRTTIEDGLARLTRLDMVYKIPPSSSPDADALQVRTRTALTQQRTQPQFLAQERFSQVVYGDHPAGRMSATPETLDAITREAMIEWHRTRFAPDHALIAFAGDITLAAARKLVESKLGAWKKAGVPKPPVTEPVPSGAAKGYLVARPNSVQTTFVVGTQSMTRTDPDYVPLTVANRVLGGTMGRLFRHLREEKGYTYGVGSGFSALAHRGQWSASTSVRTEVTEPALTDLLADIEGMRTAPVPEKELNDHKRAIVASFALSLESPEQLLGYYVQSWLYGLPADYWDRYPARVSAVTAAQVQAAATKYWDPARLQIVAVGDAKITDIMKKKGPLELYDADGKMTK